MWYKWNSKKKDKNDIEKEEEWKKMNSLGVTSKR